jgi:hypothetical protein
MSLMNFLLVGFLVYRIAVVDAPAVNRQRSFVAFPARASTVAIGLMRGQRERPPVE